MRSTQQFSITLPHDMAARVRARVASGEYASESEVIRDGLRALGEREDAVEKWLRTEVVAGYDAYMAGDGETLTIDQVRTSLAEHRAKRDAVA